MIFNNAKKTWNIIMTISKVLISCTNSNFIKPITSYPDNVNLGY